mmetsp:Transcript_18777/g.43451  ORF Transcript_18777/g.43451 Transcript_18777/m.43451 type:complete len:83 (-) Transcript_18777:132-380(-)
MYNFTPSCRTGASKTLADRTDPTTLKNSLTAVVMSGKLLTGGLEVIVDNPSTEEQINKPENTADPTAERNNMMNPVFVVSSF